MDVLKKKSKMMRQSFCKHKKKQIIDLQDHLEKFCKVFLVFGFNSAKYDINLVELNLLPMLVKERVVEQKKIKKLNQLVSFKFGKAQLLDLFNYLGGATCLVSSMKAYKTSLTKSCFQYEWFNIPENLNNTQLFHYDAFFGKLLKYSTFEKVESKLQNLISQACHLEKQSRNLN